MTIGRARRLLMMPFDCRWNGWVRDFTAMVEMRGWFTEIGDGL